MAVDVLNALTNLVRESTSMVATVYAIYNIRVCVVTHLTQRPHGSLFPRAVEPVKWAGER